MHAAQLPLSLAAHLTEPLDWQLDSPPGVHVAPTQPVSAPPSGRLLDELLDSPSPVVASSLPHGADHCEQVGAHRGKSTVSKKLCLDDGAAARLPPELPLELVCLILSFLFVDDIGNHNSAIGAVSRAWRGATELLAVAWNQDPHAIPMLAAPFVVMCDLWSQDAYCLGRDVELHIPMRHGPPAVSDWQVARSGRLVVR